mmetsp:Transcript_26096/g.37436  ORF Transcript_26096/g.37436 Transcript_26096/m.37436 type:complete len:217 (-) Transcript_26096:138-788(-)
MVLSSSKLCHGLSVILFALLHVHSDNLFVAGVSLRLTRSHEIRRFLKGPLDKKDGKKPLSNVQDIRPLPPVASHSSQSSNHGTSAESVDASSTSSSSQYEKSTSSGSQNEKSGHSVTEKSGNGIGFLVGLGAVAGLAIAAVATKTQTSNEKLLPVGDDRSELTETTNSVYVKQIESTMPTTTSPTLSPDTRTKRAFLRLKGFPRTLKGKINGVFGG